MLLRLTFVDKFDAWSNYRITFVGITPEEWEAAWWKDPRDIPWTIEWDDGRPPTPYCSAQLSWHSGRDVLGIKSYGCFYLRSPPGLWPRVRRRLGFPLPEVPQERAPLGWRRLKKRSVLRRLDSDDDTEVEDALSDLALDASAAQAPWAAALLVRHARGPGGVRLAVLAGLGELARLHGYVDRATAIPLLTDALTDRRAGVRRAAADALDVIARFAPPEAQRPRNG